jgi:hypothetical protein
MPLTPTLKDITDDYGASHQYSITPHPAEEGFVLLPVVLRIIGEAGGPLVDAFKSSDPEAILESEINGVALGLALSNLANEIVAAGGPKFCKDVLKYTTRVNSDGKEEKAAVAFNVIYQGNYGELAKAVFAVLELNFAPSLRARLASGGLSQTIASLVSLAG